MCMLPTWRPVSSSSFEGSAEYQGISQPMKSR